MVLPPLKSSLGDAPGVHFAALRRFAPALGAKSFLIPRAHMPVRLTVRPDLFSSGDPALGQRISAKIRTSRSAGDQVWLLGFLTRATFGGPWSPVAVRARQLLCESPPGRSCLGLRHSRSSCRASGTLDVHSNGLEDRPDRQTLEACLGHPCLNRTCDRDASHPLMGLHPPRQRSSSSGALSKRTSLQRFYGPDASPFRALSSDARIGLPV